MKVINQDICIVKDFTKDVEKWFNNYKIKQIIKQKYPKQSSADFYIYEKQ